MTYFDKTKTGRLKAPRQLRNVGLGNDRLNWCGQPHAQIGDYISQTGSSISAGTVGKIIDIKFDYIADLNSQGHQIGNHYTLHTPATIEFLDGHIDVIWMWYLTVIDYAAVQEVKDFYNAGGRPDRIKVSW
jgi:hypothetical protein